MMMFHLTKLTMVPLFAYAATEGVRSGDRVRIVCVGVGVVWVFGSGSVSVSCVCWCLSVSVCGYVSVVVVMCSFIVHSVFSTHSCCAAQFLWKRFVTVHYVSTR